MGRKRTDTSGAMKRQPLKSSAWSPSGLVGRILVFAFGAALEKRCSLVPQVIFREGFQQASPPLGELDNP